MVRAIENLVYSPSEMPLFMAFLFYALYLYAIEFLHDGKHSLLILVAFHDDVGGHREKCLSIFLHLAHVVVVDFHAVSAKAVEYVANIVDTGRGEGDEDVAGAKVVHY